MPLTVRVQSLLVQGLYYSEAAVVPASVVPLPAFSLQASALSVADVAQARLRLRWRRPLLWAIIRRRRPLSRLFRGC